MTSLARKCFYAVATLALFVVLGLLHAIEFTARHQTSSADVVGPTRLRDHELRDTSSLREESNHDSVATKITEKDTSTYHAMNTSTYHVMNTSTHQAAEQNISSAVVIFNVMPKSGSRTLNELAVRLAESSPNDIMVKNTMGGYSQSHEDKLREIRQFVYGSKVGFLYSHMRFQPFGINGVRGDLQRAPKYISIVRDPIDRLASLYYFVRYGDRLGDTGAGAADTAGREFRERMSRMNYSMETFNECVRNGGPSCRDSGAMVRHFCGTDKKVCSNPKTRATAYKRAIATIDDRYTAVGLMEDYLSTLRVFERLIPDMFEGVTDMYLEQKRAIVGKMKTKNKTRVSPGARKILRNEMGADYKLYSYIRRKFERLKKKMGIDGKNKQNFTLSRNNTLY